MRPQPVLIAGLCDPREALRDQLGTAVWTVLDLLHHDTRRLRYSAAFRRWSSDCAGVSGLGARVAHLVAGCCSRNEGERS